MYLSACRYGLPANPTLALCAAQACFTEFTNGSGPVQVNTARSVEVAMHTLNFFRKSGKACRQP